MLYLDGVEKAWPTRTVYLNQNISEVTLKYGVLRIVRE